MVFKEVRTHATVGSGLTTAFRHWALMDLHTFRACHVTIGGSFIEWGWVGVNDGATDLVHIVEIVGEAHLDLAHKF